jgi:serine/threonine protein kinase
VVGQHGPLPVAAACHYARQVAFGLQHAHELGFVHRDIKPANLLVDGLGVMKILDLGLVRSEADGNSGLTRQLDNKSILGTADYVAPEQAVDSSRVDIRADIYALGATLYFMLAGRPLFPEGRTAQKLVWQQIKEPVPVHYLRPEVSPELSAVVHRMLQKKPGDRFQTPIEAFDALGAHVPEEVPVPDPAWLPATPARVSLARSSAPSSNASRVSGSTSQILAAAMSTRSGTTSASGTRRKSENNVGTGSSDKMAITPNGLAKESMISTSETALDDTQRSPWQNSPAGPPQSPQVAIPFYLTVVVATLAFALLLALLGILILLLQRG